MSDLVRGAIQRRESRERGVQVDRLDQRVEGFVDVAPDDQGGCGDTGHGVAEVQVLGHPGGVQRAVEVVVHGEPVVSVHGLELRGDVLRHLSGPGPRGVGNAGDGDDRRIDG
jgi:hypothetical protein